MITTDMEKRLIQEAKRGKQQAYGKLVEMYSRRIYHAAYRILRNVEDAKDVTQEVFLRGYNAIERFDSDRPLYPWLYRITKNLCLNLIQRNGRREVSLPEMPLESHYSSVEDQLDRKDQAEDLRSAFKKLPDMYREVLELQHFEDCSYSEIAEILEIPLGTVMSRLFNGRKKLKILIEEMAYEA
jgi:RNA polymerase sigma-70 factor (ECF subfamily)